MKDKRVIRQVLTIYLVCFVARIFEYFVLRTDQTILGEAFIHKLFGIIVICLVVKRSGETLLDIGFVKNGYIRSAVKGLALGLSMFAIGYLFILSVAETIINKGYTVMSTPRHVISIIIMIIQLVVCRVIMCWYLKKHSMVLKKYTRIEE